jgi:hypothetical protein
LFFNQYFGFAFVLIVLDVDSDADVGGQHRF